MPHPYYSRRDLIGHYVDKQQRTQRPCTHACCRGYRVHPSNYPVILPDRTLRRASDKDLQAHFRKVTQREDEQGRRAEAQILHEMDRRDQADRKQRDREAHKRAQVSNYKATRAAMRMERESETERIRLDAEARTNGYLVNAKGRTRGVSGEEILTGRQSVFERYASDEARDYFARHPRPTAAYFRGQDARMHARAA
jgi:hypothetical protein